MGDTVSGSGATPQQDYAIGDVTLVPVQGGYHVHSTGDYMEGSNAIAEGSSFEAGVPVLAKRVFVNYLISLEESTHKIVISMLDSWNASIKELAERAEEKQKEVDRVKSEQRDEELTSPERIAERERQNRLIKKASEPDTTAFISSAMIPGMITPHVEHIWRASVAALLSSLGGISPTAENQKLANAAIDSSSPLVGAIGATSLELVTPSLIAAVVALPLFFSDAPPSASMREDFAVLRNGWGELNPGNELNAAQVGGWFSALWGIGLASRLAINEAKAEDLQRRSHSRKEYDIKFAKQYADAIMTSLRDPSFEMALGVMVKGAADAEKLSLSARDYSQLQAKGKLLLLSSALALLIKIDTQWLSGLDFIGLVSGKTQIDPDNRDQDPHQISDIAKRLVAMIDAERSLLPNNGEELLRGLERAFNDNPSVEHILDVHHVLSFLTAELPAEAQLNSQV